MKLCEEWRYRTTLTLRREDERSFCSICTRKLDVFKVPCACCNVSRFFSLRMDCNSKERDAMVYVYRRYLVVRASLSIFNVLTVLCATFLVVQFTGPLSCRVCYHIGGLALVKLACRQEHVASSLSRVKTKYQTVEEALGLCRWTHCVC